MQQSLGIALVGAGTIGRLHAANLTKAIADAHLMTVVDVDIDAAEQVVSEMSRPTAKVYATRDYQRVLEDEQVGAVILCSPSVQHAPQIIAAARAGKAVFCEKPLALDLDQAKAAFAAVTEARIPFQIGFNRRYDKGYAEVARAVHAGELGNVEMFRSQSSDPEPPPEAYLPGSGGYYLDSVIHDFDTARFIVGDIERVTALGRILIAPYFEKYQDVDTSIVTLEFASGAIGVIQNTCRTHYGYDLRVEVHCQEGKIITEDERETKVWRYDRQGLHADHVHYFIDRFHDAYRKELQAFVDAIHSGVQPRPDITDALESLKVAIAARRSQREGKPIAIADLG